MQVAMSEVLVLLFPLSQWLWCHIPWFLIRGKPHPCPSSFMDGQISSLSLSLPQPHPRTKYFSGGLVDSLYRAVGWGLSTGSKEDTHSRNWSSFPRKSFSFTHWGHRGSFAFSLDCVSKLEGRGWTLHPAVPSQCSALMGMVLLGLVGRAGNVQNRCQKGFPGSTLWSTKLWGAKSRVALSPETN